MRLSLRIFPPVLLALCLCAQQAVADERSHGRISGEIKNALGKPLQNALVDIFKITSPNDIPAVTGIRSNGSGLFRASNLVPGTYYLQVKREGYRTFATERFEVEEDGITSLNITLENIIDYISNKDDPRNWNLKTVMRSSSDRRMIFRYLPASVSNSNSNEEQAFLRDGTMCMASSTPIGNQQFLSHPQTNRNGVVTSFAFAEPMTRNSRMIFSGQFDVGRNTFWRFRDTIHYRPDDSHDYKVSFGYGRMNVNYDGRSSLESPMASEEQDSRESRIHSIAFGVEGSTKFYNLLSINYGFDYSHLRYGTDKGFVHPSLKIVLSPSKSWRMVTTFTSRRESDSNSVLLTGGETLNLSEPTLITVVGDNVNMSQVRHSEIAFEKTLAPETTLGVAVYKDNTFGPGLPLMVTVVTPGGQSSSIVHLRENRTPKQGMRVTLVRHMHPNFTGSIAYVYGEAINISDVDESISVDDLNNNFQMYAGQQYHHSFTGQLDAFIPETSTNLLATVRWYPGNPVSTIDWFSDPMDIGSKSLNVEIRQGIPFYGDFLSTSRWEILLDFRNVLNQGKDVIHASDGLLVLNRSPRSLRFGINLNFR